MLLNLRGDRRVLKAKNEALSDLEPITKDWPKLQELREALDANCANDLDDHTAHT